MISIIIGLLSVLLTIKILPAIIILSKKIGLIDLPIDQRKIHKVNTPVIGGVAIGVIAIFIGAVASAMELLNMHLVIVVAPFFVLFLILGMVDDRFDVPAKYKFFIQCLVASCIVYSGIYFATLDDLFGINAPDWVMKTITVLFIVGLVNSYNLIDGIDGLLGSFLIFALTFCLLASYTMDLIGVVNLLVLFLGALVVFLNQNFKRRNKIFMGDAGALSIGLVISVVLIFLFEKGFDSKGELTWIHVGAFGVVAFPVFDAIFVFMGRFLTTGSIFKPDKTHFHHLVLRLLPNHLNATIFILFMAIFSFGISLLLFFGGFNILAIFFIPSFFLLSRWIIFQMKVYQKSKQIIHRLERR